MSILLNSPEKKIGFSFVLPQTKTLSSVKFYVYTTVGPTFPLLVELRNDDQGLPGANVLASATVTPTGPWTWPTANIRTSGGQHYVALANTRYHIVVQPHGQNGSPDNYTGVLYQMDDHYFLDAERNRADLGVSLDFGAGWFARPFADASMILTCTDGTRYGCAEQGSIAYNIQGTGNECRQGQVFTATTSMAVRKVWLGVTCTPNQPSRKQYRPNANLLLVIQNVTTGHTLVNEPFITPEECSSWNGILYSHVLQNPIDIVANHQYRLYVTQEGGAGRNDADCLQYYKILGKQFGEAALSYGGTTSYSYYETGSGVTYPRNTDIYFRLDSARVELVRINQFLATPSGITIVAESKEPTNATLEYGLSTNYGSVIASQGKAIHQFEISGLSPGAEYNYRLTLNNPDDPNDTLTTENCRFRTTPQSGTIRVGVIGDTQGMDYNVMVQVMASHQHDLIVMPGDLAGIDDATLPDNEQLYDFSIREYRWTLQALTPLTKNATLYTALGNHDFPSKLNALRAYQDSVMMPANGSGDERYFSFDYGPAHFTILDNADNKIDAQQLAWLKNDLAASTKQWKIVMLHRPIRGADGSWTMANADPVHDAFCEGGVDLVLQGHRHVYNRYYKDGICYVTNSSATLWGSGNYPDGMEKSGTEMPSLFNTGGDPGTIARYIAKPGWTELEISDTHIRGRFIGILSQPLDVFTLPSSMLVTFSPDGGSFPAASTTVTVNCDDPGAVIHYTTNGREPTEQDAVVSNGGVLVIDRNLTLKARAFKHDSEPGDTKSSDFIFTAVATPMFYPDGGSYDICLDVTVTCDTPGSVIYYTLDGTEPNPASLMLVSGQTIPIDHTVTLKAVGYKAGLSASPVKTAAYTISGGLPLVFVRADGDDNASGKSWQEAKRRIQTGIDAVAAGGQVWVKQGAYTETIELRDARQVYGGFTGQETTLGQRNSILNNTTIDASSQGSVVTANVHITNAARIDGFVITGGTGTLAYGNSYGGGIYCLGSPTISGNRIAGNTAQCGGGVYLGDTSSAILENNFINSNTSQLFGGGITCGSSASATIKHNTITGNGAFNGGGMYCSGGNPLIANNIIALNETGLYIDDISAPTLRNNCVYGNSSYDCFGLQPTQSVFSFDPRLANASVSYYLLHDSPCIDAAYGDYSSSTDINGSQRPIDGNSDGQAASDIGCYEWHRRTVAAAEAKAMPDYASVSLYPKVVTAVLLDRSYVQTVDRTRGIGILGQIASVGVPVAVDGHMTTQDGERLIVPSSITAQSPASPLNPVFMSLKNLGGGAHYRQSGVTAWRSYMWKGFLVRDKYAGSGVNNIGLLVKVIGKVTNRGLSHFFVDDGFGMEEADPSTVGVRVDWPHPEAMPDEGSIIELTAISSCTLVTVDGAEHVVRMLRPVGPDAFAVLREPQN